MFARCMIGRTFARLEPSPILHRRHLAAKVTGNSPEDDLAEARKFLANFTEEQIPRRLCEVSFSRASGPGGQNVNKVNSKATLGVDLSDVLSFVPSALHAGIRSSNYVTSKSQRIVISSDASRKQNENTRNCFIKLYQLIMDAGKNSVPSETPVEQQKRVEELGKVQNHRRLKEKKKQSTKKATRKSSSGDY